MSTLVKFRKDLVIGTVFAYFPQLKERNGYRTDLMTCYSIVGQHSTCAPEYVKQCQPATPEEYADLKKELESYPYNYKLKVCK